MLFILNYLNKYLKNLITIKIINKKLVRKGKFTVASARSYVIENTNKIIINIIIIIFKNLFFVLFINLIFYKLLFFNIKMNVYASVVISSYKEFLIIRSFFLFYIYNFP